jgi:hypothetical protein
VLNLTTLSIERVMIHKIPKVRVADKDGYELETSETTIALNQDLKVFFRERVLESMNKARFSAVHAEPDGDDPATVPDLVAGYFGADMGNLEVTSQQIAHELFRAQKGSASEGILVVADARIGSGTSLGAVLVILKLENDEALLIAPATKGGKSTFTATLQQVTLPSSSKVFKAAVFPRVAALTDVRADVSDHQLNANDHGRDVSDFFLGFLGCVLELTPDRATKQFFDVTEKFVNSMTDPAEQLKLSNALAAEMDSNASTISPKDFAADHVPLEERDDYLAAVSTALDGNVQITKDTSLIENRVERTTIEFGNGVRLSGPKQAVHEMLSSEADGVWRIAAEHVRFR